MNKIIASYILLGCFSVISCLTARGGTAVDIKDAGRDKSIVKINQPLQIDVDYDGDTWHPRSITKTVLRKNKDALDYYNGYIKINPTDSRAYYNRGLLEIHLKRYTKAKEDFDMTVKLNPSMYQAYCYRGFAKFKLGDKPGALKDCNEAIAMHASDTTYRNLGVLKTWMREFCEAIGAFNKAIELNGAYVDAYVRRGRVEGQIKNYTGAYNDFAKALELDSNCAEAYIERANMKEDLGEYTSAIADCNKAIEIDPGNPQAFLNRGWEKYRMNHADSATADFNEAIRIAPGFALAYACRGATKHTTGNLKSALRDCNVAIKLDSTLYYGYNNRYLVKQGLKDYKGAQADYLKFMELEPNDSLVYDGNDCVKVKPVNDSSAVYAFGPSLPYFTKPENVSHVKNELELQNLKGRVKLIREAESIRIQTGQNSSTGLFERAVTLITRFNEQGYIVSRERILDGKVFGFSDSITIKCNKRGQIIESNADYAMTGSRHLQRYNYDDDGKLKEKIEIDPTNGSKQIYRYVDNGDEIGGEYIDSDSIVQMQWRVIYLYNDRGQKSQITRISTSHLAGKTEPDSVIWKYSYDDVGNMVEYGSYVNYKFDKDNRMVETEYYNGKGVSSITRFKYDDKDNVIEESYYRPNGKFRSKSRMIYEYDGPGNWIKTTFIFPSQHKSISERVIEYY